MKIPKYIEHALIQRRKSAIRFTKLDSIISNYCDKHKIEAESIYCHSESLLNPYEAEQEVKEAILAKEC